MEINMRLQRQTLRGLFAIVVTSSLMVGALISRAPMAGAAASAPAPVVTSLSPSFGTAGDETPVTISGSNFTGATAVSFGSDNGSGFLVVYSTRSTGNSPPGM